MRAGVLAPLAEWIEREWCAPRRRPTLRLLDLGCGDLLLARLLPDCRIDGVDNSPAARSAARSTLADLPLPGQVFDANEDVPEGTYDGVVASSMAQYLPDLETVASTIERAALWLRPQGAAGVVMTDVVPLGGSRVADGVDLLRFAIEQQGVVRGVSLAIASARRSPGKLLVVPDCVIARAAMSAALGWHRLPANLSPLRHRATHYLPAARK